MNWLDTLQLRRAGKLPGFIGDGESLADYNERSRVTVIPAPPRPEDTPTNTPPGWWADPYQRHELRFYDGVEWTEHVADKGAQGIDPVPEHEPA